MPYPTPFSKPMRTHSSIPLAANRDIDSLCQIDRTLRKGRKFRSSRGGKEGAEGKKKREEKRQTGGIPHPTTPYLRNGKAIEKHR
ncbi:hypothetical protein CEXT_356841 [Caerostris extrusa]|uniref:Uncharacterized protein n=1 Tax=Caerostris extrusa TaxID=172846 RepID=A0AAV4Y5D4_CAEEX|nr:hypothetical protein CEXT_356841 [Caerostris extrusa]